MKQEITFYSGTYTCQIKFGTGKILDGKGEGIYVLNFNLENGKLTCLKTIKGVANPSYIALDNQRKYLYAVNELKSFEGKSSGSVSAFKISNKKSYLTFINKQETGGTDPCFVALNPHGTQLYVTNFMSGSICIYDLIEDGSISTAKQFIQHKGSSIDLKRQAGPHTHSIVFSNDGSYAFVPDLGLDKLMAYRVDQKTGFLSEGPMLNLSTLPGAGPRHCAFDNTGKYCYLINELDCTILVISYFFTENNFRIIQSVSSIPDGEKIADNTCADVHITPNGEYLYGSNRGLDNLIIYNINKETGILSYAGSQLCGGKTPRNFVIDPTGKYLLCANQDSDSIVVFEINQDTGSLTKRTETNIPTPVCLKY